MNKLFIALALCLASCATVPSKAPETVVSVPAVECSENQKEDLADAEFKKFWDTQDDLVTLYLFKELGIPLSLDLVSSVFSNDYTVSLAHVKASNGPLNLNIYVVAIKINDEWNVISVGIKEQLEFMIDEVKKEAQEKNKDEDSL